MKKIIVLTMCIAFTFVTGTANGQPHGHKAFTQEDPPSKTWEIDDSETVHFEIGDTFTLTENPNGKVKFKAKGALGNRLKKEFDFDSLFSGYVPYLCAKVSMKHVDKDAEKYIDKRVVISLEKPNDPDNVYVQIDNWNEVDCQPANVAFPSHGGLAHAHVSR